jgi:hypothetical protein
MMMRPVAFIEVCAPRAVQLARFPFHQTRALSSWMRRTLILQTPHNTQKRKCSPSELQSGKRFDGFGEPTFSCGGFTVGFICGLEGVW